MTNCLEILDQAFDVRFCVNCQKPMLPGEVRECVAPGRHTNPSLAARGLSLAHAAFAFVLDGCAVCDVEMSRQRLIACHQCEYFTNTQCGLCGCYVTAKVQIRAENCPHVPSKWPVIESA